METLKIEDVENAAALAAQLSGLDTLMYVFLTLGTVLFICVAIVRAVRKDEWPAAMLPLTSWGLISAVAILSWSATEVQPQDPRVVEVNRVVAAMGDRKWLVRRRQFAAYANSLREEAATLRKLRMRMAVLSNRPIESVQDREVFAAALASGEK
jgi:hypothetical protein